MKVKLSKVPKFKTEEEEAQFWQNHSPLEFRDEFEEVPGVHFPSPKRRIIALRMNDQQVKSIKHISEKKGIGFSTLIRMWVLEKLGQERKTLRAGFASARK